MRLRKFRPMFVFTFMLYVGLYQVTFQFRAIFNPPTIKDRLKQKCQLPEDRITRETQSSDEKILTLLYYIYIYIYIYKMVAQSG